MSRPLNRLGVSALILVAVVAAAAAATSRFAREAPDPTRIVLNDMQNAAGTLAGAVLTLELEAREGDWLPEGPDGPRFTVAAFAEAGQPLQNPGPLLRLRSGTEAHVTVRNTLAMPLMIYGLGAQRGVHADSVLIEAGASHEFRFTAGEPGVYYYAGRTTPVPLLLRSDHDSQLNGVIVIDPPEASGRPRDRLFVIAWHFTLDSTTVSGLGPDPVLVINGASWPHTERFDITQGDAQEWRWINMTLVPHPMHLHGFYFRVTGAGDGAVWTEPPPAEQALEVTHVMMPGTTLATSWTPDRPGNWIFHCHFAGHMAPITALEKDRRHPQTILAAAPHDHGAPVGGPSAHGVAEAADGHGEHQMAGLVIGIRVKPRGRAAAPSPDERPIRLLLRSQPNIYGEYAGYGFVLGGTAAENDPSALTVPGPTLLLRKDERVAITLLNQSHEPAAVHWHGIELESLPDGVPGWSGYGRDVLPAIPAGDSLTVRFTPPRTGTFIYHSHFNEFQQIGSGMYGAIVVLDEPAQYDPETDRVLLFSDAGPTINLINGPFPGVLLNGQAQPEPIELRAGVRYRLRLINIGAESIVALALLDGEAPVHWRQVAKDGADLPPARAVTAPAHLMFASGETYDMEFTPAAPGELTLRYGPPEDFPGAPPPVHVPVRVR
jgi:manganese oxidase